jgi:hypothetical protein
MRNKPQVLIDSINDLLKMLEHNKIHPHIGQVFPLNEVRFADVLFNVSWFVHLWETWLGNNVSWFVHL